jgi:hypothetical protein
MRPNLEGTGAVSAPVFVSGPMRQRATRLFRHRQQTAMDDPCHLPGAWLFIQLRQRLAGDLRFGMKLPRVKRKFAICQFTRQKIIM